ncbi:hypothetical protein [Methylobacterium platani]|uniref:hypothetical protein n=1 Tax=Methylobacterium platani TaxID=427683 RepID=UPI0012E2750F|nr:hypothetical protein [Methylobacterium platani]
MLLKVYGSSLDEYRFNVNLGWDQTKFYVTTATAATTAGIGLLKLALDSLFISFFMLLYFLLPIMISLLGLKTIEVRKKYIRSANRIKTIAERELGLLNNLDNRGLYDANLSIAVTPGQKDYSKFLFRYTDKLDEKIKIGSVSSFTQFLLCLIIAINITGVVFTVGLLSYLVDVR